MVQALPLLHGRTQDPGNRADGKGLLVAWHARRECNETIAPVFLGKGHVPQLGVPPQ